MLTFDEWFSRYEDIFSEDGNQLDDAAKIRLLLRKLDTSAHTRYTNFVLPKKPKELDFKETVEKLQAIFGKQESAVSVRYKCLQTSKHSLDDFVKYAGIVNANCEKFNMRSLTTEQFKCLIFVIGLRDPSYAEIRVRLLSKLETDANLTLEKLLEECHKLANLKKDANLIESAQQQTSAVGTKNIKNSLRIKITKIMHHQINPNFLVGNVVKCTS